MFRCLAIAMSISLFLMAPAAFGKASPIVIGDVEVNALEIARILRYDFVLRKTEEFVIDDRQEDDSPGHHFFSNDRGLNFAVRPNNKLASLMELETDTKYVKMQLRGGGSGNLRETDEVKVSLEYAIKESSNIGEVKKYALDATLFVLKGNTVITEIPLSNVK